MKTRNKWRKEARKTNDPFAWSSSYRNLKRQIKYAIRTAEREFVKQQIESNNQYSWEGG